MPLFISKLQHKNYEKGEFSDEQPRSLEDTVQLIKNFPWDDERPLTDIQLTGPSVTIHNDQDEYLKLGLYFNGKFCIYFLNNHKHVFEYHAPDISIALNKVQDFFGGRLDTNSFERHLIDINPLSHFTTNLFEYHTKLWRTVMLSWAFIFYWCITLLALIASLKKYSLIPVIVTSIFCLLLSWALIWIFKRHLFYSKMYLQLSKGHQQFRFGYNYQQIKDYDKKDIKEIISYESVGSRSPNMFEVYIIRFNNGEEIKLSNILISSFDFARKFDPALIVNGKKSSLRAL